MPKQRKKKLNILLLCFVVLVAVALVYPSAKKLFSMAQVYERPAKMDKEAIYSYIEEGDVRLADLALDDKYELSRFDPVELQQISWNEDPYSDIYWRFNFYNLEPARNLLHAWLETGEEKYREKLVQFVSSFIEKGQDGPYSWDYHGAAFRTMTLVNIRAKLEKGKALDADFDRVVAQSLARHGDFLADPRHFEPEYNHGLDQAAALYLLAVNHPELPRSGQWLELASQRLVSVLEGIVDEDGILVENSPYYHLYVLEKVYEINRYLDSNGLEINGFGRGVLDKMASYATYMLQPDLQVPTVGASITRKIELAGIYRQLAASNMELLYVLSQGVYGVRPEQLNVHYPDSGQTIMRSSWGKGEDFSRQTQLIFDVGDYRTNHSDLDALSFHLFGQGIALMPDAGLYTYEPGPYRSYFHGTRAHNTVVVDGKDQAIGNNLGTANVTAGFFQQGEGYAYQSAQHNLYAGVIHKRAIMMIEDSTIIVLDRLESEQEHLYEQLFHLFPGAKVTTDGLNVSAISGDAQQSLAIRQYDTQGLELNSAFGNWDVPAGLCSSEYNKAVPCRSVSYSKKSKNASFVTVISIGKKTDIIFDKERNSLSVVTNKQHFSIDVSETEDIKRAIQADKAELSQLYSASRSLDQLNEPDDWTQSKPNGFLGASVSFDQQQQSMKVVTPADASNFEVIKDVDLDLSGQNLYFKAMVEDSKAMQGFDVYLSNNDWQQNVVFYASGSTFDVDRSGEWLQMGFGKSRLRDIKHGGWALNGGSFDWSKIDAIQITLQSHQGKNAAISFKDFMLVPDQQAGRAVIVFDDGWASVMDASELMQKHGFKGNVGVIADNVGKKNFLGLEQLKALQNELGWEIANHSSFHKNAVEEYSSKGRLDELESDVVEALQFLDRNEINSAPNWYIYPNGAVDNSVKDIVGKYYTFGRATSNKPEVFPFSDPLEIGVFSIYTDRAEPADIQNAVSDAIEFNHTLFLMFHKFSRGEPEVYTEISLADFDTILADIKRQGLKVVTLSELDQENGISQTRFGIKAAQPSQLRLNIKTSPSSNVFFRAILN